MKVINLLFMLLSIVSVSISVHASEIKEVGKAKFISCNNLTQQQISAKIKNDFIQTRLPSWKEDKKLLGPR